MLFLLLLLRKPRMRVIYVTGRPVPESVVEYYLACCPASSRDRRARRLHMVATHDGAGPLAGGEAARAPARARGDPRADPGSRALPPRARTRRPRSSAISR